MSYPRPVIPALNHGGLDGEVEGHVVDGGGQDLAEVALPEPVVVRAAVGREVGEQSPGAGHQVRHGVEKPESEPRREKQRQ